MNKKNLFGILIYSLVGMLFLAGCASNRYACDGRPDGVTCADPMTVYRLTEEADQVVDVNKKKKTKNDELTGEEKKKEQLVASFLHPPVDMAKPVLQPAQVLRVWIAPWVDEAQDLHGASYVFTEITPRRWTLGEHGEAIPRATYPFQVGATTPQSSQSSPTGADSLPTVKAPSGKVEPPPQTAAKRNNILTQPQALEVDEMTTK